MVCENCNRADFANEEVERFRVAVDGTTLVLRNACNGGQLTQGMVNWATGFFLAGVIGLISLYLRAREVRFDEDK